MNFNVFTCAREQRNLHRKQTNYWNNNNNNNNNTKQQVTNNNNQQTTNNNKQQTTNNKQATNKQQTTQHSGIALHSRPSQLAKWTSGLLCISKRSKKQNQKHNRK